MKNVEVVIYLVYANDIDSDEVKFLKHQIQSMLEFQVKNAVHYHVEASQVIEIE